MNWIKKIGLRVSSDESTEFKVMATIINTLILALIALGAVFAVALFIKAPVILLITMLVVVFVYQVTVGKFDGKE